MRLVARFICTTAVSFFFSGCGSSNVGLDANGPLIAELTDEEIASYEDSNGRYDVCHRPPGNTDNDQSLSLGTVAAVQAHTGVGHDGCTLGLCGEDTEGEVVNEPAGNENTETTENGETSEKGPTADTDPQASTDPDA